MTKAPESDDESTDLVELDALDSAEWASGQSTPEVGDAKLAGLVKESKATPGSANPFDSPTVRAASTPEGQAALAAIAEVKRPKTVARAVPSAVGGKLAHAITRTTPAAAADPHRDTSSAATAHTHITPSTGSPIVRATSAPGAPAAVKPVASKPVLALPDDDSEGWSLPDDEDDGPASPRSRPGTAPGVVGAATAKPREASLSAHPGAVPIVRLDDLEIEADDLAIAEEPGVHHIGQGGFDELPVTRAAAAAYVPSSTLASLGAGARAASPIATPPPCATPALPMSRPSGTPPPRPAGVPHSAPTAAGPPSRPTPFAYPPPVPSAPTQIGPPPSPTPTAAARATAQHAAVEELRSADERAAAEARRIEAAHAAAEARGAAAEREAAAQQAAAVAQAHHNAAAAQQAATLAAVVTTEPTTIGPPPPAMEHGATGGYPIQPRTAADGGDAQPPFALLPEQQVQRTFDERRRKTDSFRVPVSNRKRTTIIVAIAGAVGVALVLLALLRGSQRSTTTVAASGDPAQQTPAGSEGGPGSSTASGGGAEVGSGSGPVTGPATESGSEATAEPGSSATTASGSDVPLTGAGSGTIDPPRTRTISDATPRTRTGKHGKGKSGAVTPPPVDPTSTPAVVVPDDSAAKRDRAKAAYEQGNQALFSGDPAGAIKAYREALRLDPGFAAGHRGLGLAYGQQGDTANSVKSLQAYVDAAPNARDVNLIKQRIAALRK